MIKKRKLPPDTRSRLTLLKPHLESDRRVLFAYLFGSMATGVQRPLSDIDIAVYLDEATVTFELKLELLGQLTDLLGTDEIDLVILNSAPLSLAGRILEKRLVISDREPFRRHAYESRIMREFFDFQRKEESILLRRFAHGG